MNRILIENLQLLQLSVASEHNTLQGLHLWLIIIIIIIIMQSPKGNHGYPLPEMNQHLVVDYRLHR